MDRIEEIRARAEKASRGPWELYCAELRRGLGVEVIEVLSHGKPIIKWPGFDGVDLSGEKKRHNADFMAHAREDIPYLLIALASKDKRIEELEGDIETSIEFLKTADKFVGMAVTERNTLKDAMESLEFWSCTACEKNLVIRETALATDALKEGGE